MSAADTDVVKPGRVRAFATLPVLLVVAFFAGIVVGRSLAYETSRGGLGGIIGAGLWVYGTLFVLVVLFAVVAIRARVRRRPLGSALRPLAVASLILAGGAIVGNVSAGFTGGLYRPARILESSGTITLRLEGAVGYVAADAIAATCTSVPDGLDVAAVTGLELGTLGGRRLRGSVSLPFGNEADARAELWIDAADLPDGATQPTWSGAIAVSNRPGEDRPGLATFGALALAKDPKLPPYDDVFPEALAGGFEWSCAPFSPI
ncbi:MAG TPA: hypothetical protein VF119_07735 [Candidatus Limnocylindrales bacterium]